MDDFNTNLLSEARNEYSSRLLNILTPLVIQGFRSIFKEAYDLCIKNEESTKYLMTFQNFLTRVPKWNQEIINVETDRIIKTSKCEYLEDILTCVHITQLKILTSIRVSSQQKKIEIDIPKISDFVHRVYIEAARKIYQNVYLFEKNIMPLQQQKNMRECEIIVRECILRVISDSMPIEKILRAYIDETEEEEIIEETVEKPVEEVKELLEKEKETESTDENKTSDETSNLDSTEQTASVTKVESETTAETTETKPTSIVESLETKPANEESKTKPDNVVINTQPMTNEITPPVVDNKISFNDNDAMINYNVNDKSSVIKSENASLVSAPKTIERLEKISKEMNEKRKEEEAEYDDDDDFGFENDKIKIFNESPKLELDKLDVHDVSKELTMDDTPLLDDVVELV
jgi:hypothetical protein